MINYEKNSDYKKRASVDIIIPVLNEEETIGSVIDEIQKQNNNNDFTISIIVIDGGSTDKTKSICKNKNVNFVIQKGKGKGNAMKEAVDIYSKADIVVFVDGDGTYFISELRSIVLPLLNDSADMVVGTRIQKENEKGSITPLNLIGNKLFNKFINFAMNAHVTDSLSGYRSLYRKTFQDLVLFSHSFDIEVEITVEALAKGYRILEIPMHYGTRKQSSKTKLNPVNDGIKIAKTLLFILLNVNPLMFFGIIAIAFFVSGLYPGMYVLNEKISTGEIISIPSVIFSTLLFVVGSISLVVGILSEVVVRSRRRIEYLISKQSKL